MPPPRSIQSLIFSVHLYFQMIETDQAKPLSHTLNLHRPHIDWYTWKIWAHTKLWVFCFSVHTTKHPLPLQFTKFLFTPIINPFTLVPRHCWSLNLNWIDYSHLEAGLQTEITVSHSQVPHPSARLRDKCFSERFSHRCVNIRSHGTGWCEMSGHKRKRNLCVPKLNSPPTGVFKTPSQQSRGCRA